MKTIQQANLLNIPLQKIYWIAYKLKLAYNFIIHPNTHGVYIAVWCKGKILLIKNSYKQYYTLPCGGINKNETAKQGGVRELSEEVNIQVSDRDLIFAGSFLSLYEYMNDHITLYEIYFSDIPSFQCDNREVIWAGFKKPEEVLKMDLFPMVRNYLSTQSGFKKI